MTLTESLNLCLKQSEEHYRIWRVRLQLYFFLVHRLVLQKEI